MARKTRSELTELLKLIRRIVVLAVAAYGLAREMPYPVLLLRLAILWGLLYISTLSLDAVLKRLSYRAAVQNGTESANS